MPLYELKCICGKHVEEFFMVNEEKRCRCIACGEMMQRMFSPPSIRMGIQRAPTGTVEVGNEYPKAPSTKDCFADAEREMAHVIEQAPDLDGSGDCELSRLHA